MLLGAKASALGFAYPYQIPVLTDHIPWLCRIVKHMGFGELRKLTGKGKMRWFTECGRRHGSGSAGAVWRKWRRGRGTAGGETFCMSAIEDLDAYKTKG